MKYSACLVGGLILLPINVDAQVVPDGSLSTEVTTSDRLNYIIEAGNRQGNNLFHSFESFSVPTNGSVLFNNATDLQNIFSRVTGGSISEIDGLIRSLGEANLFLLNPNGIIFGEGAALDIGGSLIASTGESINFADGTKFSAINSNDEPLLTVSIPIGLQYGSNPGEIKVFGRGQQIVFNRDPLFLSPLVRTDATANLEVAPEKTLALVGGNVTLEGSSIRANEGRIELGSVSSGIVALEPNDSGWQLDYSKATIDRDLEMRSLSAIDTSSTKGLQIVGRQITINDGSVVSLQASKSGSETEVKFAATELININGTDSTSLLPSSINIENSGQNSTNLEITSRDLVVERGGRIIALQRAIDRGGNLNLNISDRVVVKGVSPFSDEANSILGIGFLGVVNIGVGDGGDVNLQTNQLEIDNGAVIASVTIFGTGAGGDVKIEATESIEVKGKVPLLNPDGNSPSSSISTSTLGKGNGGRIDLKTARLTLSEGGDINSNTLDSGNAGAIKINASQFVQLIATDKPNQGSSTIESVSINNNSTELRTNFNLPASPSGDAGSITIETPRFNAIGSTGVFVTTEGKGQTGTIEINTERLFLKNESRLSASTVSESGGNISLQVSDLLLLEDNSSISAKAGNQGNGGNIAIASDLVTLTENSRIEASAVAGNGGNIQLQTKGFFYSSDSTVDASSRLGIDGIVQIDRLDTNPISGLENITTKIIDSTQLVILSCDLDTENSFIVTGRGGISAGAEDILSSTATWQDWRIPREVTIDSNLESFNFIQEPRDRIVEAQGWKTNRQGKIVLTAKMNPQTNSPQFWQQSRLCPQ